MSFDSLTVFCEKQCYLGLGQVELLHNSNFSQVSEGWSYADLTAVTTVSPAIIPVIAFGRISGGDHAHYQELVINFCPRSSYALQFPFLVFLTCTGVWETGFAVLTGPFLRSCLSIILVSSHILIIRWNNHNPPPLSTYLHSDSIRVGVG